MLTYPAHSHDEHVAGGLVVLHVSAEARYPQSVVAPVGGVYLNVAVALQEDHLAVVIADHLERGHLGVKAALKLDRQVGHLEALDAWFVRARGQDELMVGAHADASAYAGHIKVLNELYLASRVHLLLQLGPLASVGEPLWGKEFGFRGFQGGHCRL